MTDPVKVALIGFGSVILTQIVALVISMRINNRQSTQLVEIRTLADGNLTKVSGALEVANQKINGLEKLVTEMVTSKKDAKDLADKRES